MSTTNFSGPVSTGEDTGVPTTSTLAFAPVVKQVLVNQADPEVDVTIPVSTVKKLGFVPTSAFTGTDPVSAMNVTFSNGSVTLGVVVVSANTRYAESTVVSGAVIDSAATITVALSAVSTTVFTGGGGRAFIEYLQVE